ncbi:hypothetical protein FDP41_000264 [Naegleria fowleri]|uniref:J domain-containing protein n=1 Tax=Naegleria fowleri TaxID=5763 RepID=A0A6A5CIT7_NAEFO|nr:uncharacterized protein FDP41_000264 [Naegleria fowleri]KAF0985225.1 hypothetical protein FDP41_000264 [Naegleria fowleri]
MLTLRSCRLIVPKLTDNCRALLSHSSTITISLKHVSINNNSVRRVNSDNLFHNFGGTKRCFHSSCFFNMARASTKNPYEILGCEFGASEDVVRKSYIKLSKKYHPDLNKTEEAKDKMAEINAAYAQIKKGNVQDPNSGPFQGTGSSDPKGFWGKDPFGSGAHYNPFDVFPFNDDDFLTRLEKYKRGEKTWFTDSEHTTFIGLMNKHRKEQRLEKERKYRENEINNHFKNQPEIIKKILLNSPFVFAHAYDIKMNGMTPVKAIALGFKLLTYVAYATALYLVFKGLSSFIKSGAQSKAARMKEIEDSRLRGVQNNRYRVMTSEGLKVGNDGKKGVGEEYIHTRTQQSYMRSLRKKIEEDKDFGHHRQETQSLPTKTNAQ